jgi:nucleoside-diphosphate-sugar epimerase
MKILIIGGKGYIGTALLDYLSKKEELSSIICVDANNYSDNVNELDNITYIDNYYQDLDKDFFKEFTDIILLAGQGSVSNSKNVLNVIDNNIRNFAWLLENINEDQKLIYASSSSVYGKTAANEVKEEYNNYVPYNYYDFSKHSIDKIAELSNKHYYGLRFGTVNGFSRNLRTDLMLNSMIYNCKIDNNFYVYNKEINRPILGINDLCNSIWMIITKGKKELSGIYNVCSFNANVEEIANEIKRITKIDYECNNNKIEDNKIINYKLQTTSYNFKINSDKFIEKFNFKFNDTISTIVNDLIDKWDLIENKMNRMEDKFHMQK